MTHADDVNAMDIENPKFSLKVIVKVFGAHPINSVFNNFGFIFFAFKKSPANSIIAMLVWYIKNVFGLESIQIKIGITPKNRSDAMSALNPPSQTKCSAPEMQPL